MATAVQTQPKIGISNTIKMSTSIIPQKMNIRIRVLHAVDYPEIAQKFYEGQREVLKEFNVDGKITSIKDKWWENLYSYMIVAEDIETGELGGGMRLDVIDDSHSIPVERALSYIQPDIIDRMHKYDNVLAETCGMWISKRFSDRNLPKILMRCSISIASKLRIKVLLGFANQYTRKMTEDMGFTIVKNVGNDGTFSYPDERYKTSLVELYVNEHNNATPEELEMINWLRTHPVQKVRDDFKGRITKFDYDLRIM